jgi:hypothetical protein
MFADNSKMLGQRSCKLLFIKQGKSKVSSGMSHSTTNFGSYWQQHNMDSIRDTQWLNIRTLDFWQNFLIRETVIDVISGIVPFLPFYRRNYREMGCPVRTSQWAGYDGKSQILLESK